MDVAGVLTHGRLPENANHGGELGGLPDLRRILSTAPLPGARVPISGFFAARGDINVTGRAGASPRCVRGAR